MHPEITRTIAALRVDEMHAAAGAAVSLPRTGSGSAAAAGGRNGYWQRLLGRWAPGWPQPA